MSSDACLPLQKPLLQILSNIVAGIHPPNPAGPSSVLEYFTRTRYSNVIRPEILKEWNGQNHIDDTHTLDVKENLSEPSLVFCDKISKRLFEALSDEELAQVTEEYHKEWISAKKSYEHAMKAMYGGLDIEQIMDDIHDILGMILTTLETLTNNPLILWAGGTGKQGLGFISVSSDNTKNEKPFYVPEARKTLFEQMVKEVMSAQQDTFLSKCVAMSTLLPSNIFDGTSHKHEPIEVTRFVADKLGFAMVQHDTSPLSPISPGTVSPGSGDDDDERMTLTPSPHAENIFSSVHPLIERGGSNSSNSSMGNESDQPLLTRKRARMLGAFSPALLKPSKKVKLIPTYSSPSPSPLPRRSSRNPTGYRPLSIGQNSRLTRGRSPHATQAKSLQNAPARQTLNRRSTMPPPPGLLRRSHSREISLPLIHHLGQLKATHHVLLPPLSAPSVSYPVHIRPKDKYPNIPANCPAPLEALIENIPKSASWLWRALGSILELDVGPKYYRLVVFLIELETLHGFGNGRHGLSATGRPEALSKWVGNGRSRFKKSNVVDNTSAYAKGWWKWWRSLQPKWRVFDKTGLPSISIAEPPLRGAWNCLLVPGANGFLSVVASLYWWGCGVIVLKGKQRKGEEEDWNRALEDCARVMECLVKAMKARREANKNGTSGPQKGTYREEEGGDEDEDNDQEDNEEDELQEA